jgi:hypothetical protein
MPKAVIDRLADMPFTSGGIGDHSQCSMLLVYTSYPSSMIAKTLVT